MIQWFKNRAFTTECLGLVPGCQTKILQAMWHGQKIFLKRRKGNGGMEFFLAAVYSDSY